MCWIEKPKNMDDINSFLGQNAPFHIRNFNHFFFCSKYITFITQLYRKRKYYSFVSSVVSSVFAEPIWPTHGRCICILTWMYTKWAARLNGWVFWCSMFDVRPRREKKTKPQYTMANMHAHSPTPVPQQYTTVIIVLSLSIRRLLHENNFLAIETPNNIPRVMVCYGDALPICLSQHFCSTRKTYWKQIDENIYPKRWKKTTPGYRKAIFSGL